MKLSTGQESTLGTYLDNCKAFGFDKAAVYLERKICETPRGRDEPVLADERQMMLLIANLENV